MDQRGRAEQLIAVVDLAPEVLETGRLLRVVLVRPHSPGNVGAAARACKNFGAELVLVDPRCPVDHADALAMASGAEDVLARAQRTDRVEAELIVALTSLRNRNAAGLPFRAAWSDIPTASDVALVFGPERGGLTTEELRTAHAVLEIPTRPEFPTLNLAQAVAVALSRFASLASMPGPPDPLPESEALDLPGTARVIDELRAALRAVSYPAPGHNPGVVHELEQLLYRARPTSRETKLLLAVLAALRPSSRC